jgi:ubiquinone/menaquinone biosynthesis C-methylase UbiE
MRRQRLDKLARVYDEEVLPIWSARFGAMILRDLPLPPRATVLDVGCGTGYPALEILRRLDDGGRIIAIDPAAPLLDVARRKAAALAGKRIFFRTEGLSPRLPFAAEVYDLVVANEVLGEVDEPKAAVAEFARVCKIGGRVVVSLPLAGTWAEFHDIYREVLIKHDRHETLARLEEHIARLPDAETAAGWFDDAGMADVTIEVDQFHLLFRSSREFFFAPVIEYGPLVVWKELAGRGEEMQDVFWYIKEALDRYFGDRGFAVSVQAGCVRGVKPPPPAAAPPPEPAPPPADELPADLVRAPRELLVIEEPEEE